jgi:hypothetical protein
MVRVIPNPNLSDARSPPHGIYEAANHQAGAVGNHGNPLDTVPNWVALKPLQARPAVAHRTPMSIEDMVSAIDIEGLAGDKPRCVMGEERGRYPDVLDADETAGGSLLLGLVEQLVKLGNS